VVILPIILSLLWETDDEGDDTHSVADSDSTESISDTQQLQQLLDGKEDVNISRT